MPSLQSNITSSTVVDPTPTVPRGCSSSTQATSRAGAKEAAASIGGFGSGTFNLSASVQGGEPTAQVGATQTHPTASTASNPPTTARARVSSKDKGKSPVIRSSPRSKDKSSLPERRTFSLSGETLGYSNRSSAILSVLGMKKKPHNKRKPIFGVGLYTNLETGRQTFYPGLSGENWRNKKRRGAATPSSEGNGTQESQSTSTKANQG